MLLLLKVGESRLRPPITGKDPVLRIRRNRPSERHADAIWVPVTGSDAEKSEPTSLSRTHCHVVPTADFNQELVEAAI
jgi:hypothetical protein